MEFFLTVEIYPLMRQKILAPFQLLKVPEIFLLDFHHSYIPLRLIIVKWDPKVIHEGQSFSPILLQSFQQMLGLSSFSFFHVF